jgi:hypothetical protein
LDRAADEDRRVPNAQRAAVALAVAVATAAWVYWGATRDSTFRSDFDQILFAGRAVAHGIDPYPLIGPGRAFDQPWPLYYPPAATFVALPFVGLATVPARVAYALAVAFSLTFLLLRHGYSRLTAVMSGAYLQAMSLLQWSPLMACALLAPAFAWVAAAKPNAGLQVIAAARDVRALRMYVAGSLIALALSFALVPSWPGEWITAIRSAPHVRPYILRPGGALLLLSVLRWRRPEARYLFALALVPTSTGPADSLILFTFPHSLRQGLALALLTHAAYFYAVFRAPPRDIVGQVAVGSAATLMFVLLPALVAILLRPNVGPARPSNQQQT